MNESVAMGDEGESRGQKIGSRETIAFRRRDSVRNYNALWRETRRAADERDIPEERATHMHEHA